MFPMMDLPLPTGPLPGASAGTVTLGVGIDVVAVERFAAALGRTPNLAARLFTADERLTTTGNVRSVASLAARFAAKEAVSKALGVPAGLEWHDCTVRSTAAGRPLLQLTDTVAAAATAQGITGWHLSLSHDAGIAAAVVIAVGPGR